MQGLGNLVETGKLVVSCRDTLRCVMQGSFSWEKTKSGTHMRAVQLVQCQKHAWIAPVMKQDHEDELANKLRYKESYTDVQQAEVFRITHTTCTGGSYAPADIKTASAKAVISQAKVCLPLQLGVHWTG